MKRHKALPVVVVLVVVALGAGAYYLWAQRGDEQAATSIVASGTVDADQVRVAALVGGRIARADLEEGDVVASGDDLYRVDDRALRLQVNQASAAVTAAKTAYDEARADDDTKAEIAAAKAAWQQAVAAERIARIQLGYASVRAPATGTVTAVASRVGELASPGRTLATITRTDELFVRVFVPEPRIGDVTVGGSATIETDSGATVEGAVTFIASEAQFTPSSVETEEQRAKLVYEVRVRPASAEGLTPGMPVTVTIGQ
jgi:HlyD family secretion protein